MAEMDEEDDSCGNIGTNRYQTMPSLQALQQMRNRLHTAFLGKRLMKWTALATGKELRKISGQLNLSLEGTYVTEYQQALIELARCRYYNTEFYKVLLEDLGPEAHITCTTTPKFIAGTKIMLIEMHEDGPVYEPYSCLGLGGEMLRKTRETWRNLLKDMILITQLRCSFSIVYKSNRDATKKKNVMQKIIIPKTMNTIRYILSELEEMEREDFFRLKKIKNLKKKGKDFSYKRVDPADEVKYVCKTICPFSYPYFEDEPKSPPEEPEDAVICIDPKKPVICDVPKQPFTRKIAKELDLEEALKLKPHVVKQILPPPIHFYDEEVEHKFPCEICKIVAITEQNEQPSKKVELINTPTVSYPKVIEKKNEKIVIDDDINTTLDKSVEKAEYLLAPVIREVTSDDITELINMVRNGLIPTPIYEAEPEKNIVTKTAEKSVRDVMAFLDKMLKSAGINTGPFSKEQVNPDGEKCKFKCEIKKFEIPDDELKLDDDEPGDDEPSIEGECIPTCETKIFKKGGSEEVFKAASHGVQVGQITKIIEAGKYTETYLGEEIKEVVRTTRIFDKDGNIIDEKRETSITTAPLQDRTKDEAISGRSSDFIEKLAQMTSTSATCGIPEGYPKNNDNLLKLPAILLKNTSIQSGYLPFTASSQCIREKDQPKPRVCGSCVIKLPDEPKGWANAGEELLNGKPQMKKKNQPNKKENQSKKPGQEGSKIRRQTDEEVEIRTNTYEDFVKASVKSCGVTCEKSFCLILECCKKKNMCTYPCDLEKCSCDDCEFRRKP